MQVLHRLQMKSQLNQAKGVLNRNEQVSWIKYLLADQDVVLHSLKSGRAKYRGGPQGPKSGPPGPIASALMYSNATESFKVEKSDWKNARNFAEFTKNGAQNFQFFWRRILTTLALPSACLLVCLSVIATPRKNYWLALREKIYHGCICRQGRND